MASKRRRLSSSGRPRVFPVARRKYEIGPGADSAVTHHRVSLHVDHLALTEGSLMSGLLQGRRSRASDRGQRSQVRARIRLQPCAGQPLGQHSAVAGRPGVGPGTGPPPASRQRLVVLVASREHAGRKARGTRRECRERRERRAIGNRGSGGRLRCRRRRAGIMLTS